MYGYQMRQEGAYALAGNAVNSYPPGFLENTIDNSLPQDSMVMAPDPNVSRLKLGGGAQTDFRVAFAFSELSPLR